MKKNNRVPYNTTLDVDLLKQLKILAAKQDKRHNDLLDEAMQDVLKKHGVKSRNQHKYGKNLKKKGNSPKNRSV